MRMFSVLTAMVLAFALTVFAQTPSPNDTQTGSSASQGSTSSQGSMGQTGTTGQTGSMGQSSDQGNMGKSGKESKVRGCIRSEGGSYMLEDAHGRMWSLTSSQDLSAHVGHEVVVHGTKSGSGSSSMSNTSSAGNSAGSITADKIDMVSDTCKLGGKHGAKGGNMGTSGTSNNPPQSPQ
ncbi:MAG TPA: DUF5818 domain-containing protein [Terriglobales bacterium]|nr:DUF5818 domain-containing protein [Terriglobales bacterium]